MAGGKIDILVEPDTRGFPSKLASGLRSASGIASSIGRGLGLAVAAGTGLAAVGLKNVIELGNEYQGNLNELQAVSGATAIQMAKVGQTAKALGSDMSLPATSAADAANAMVELAKGGLSVDEAMQAAKGTLQLAAAAQVDGATAAELQAAALNSFGLEASQAGRVADVLANTANASASSMIDVGNSLKYVAPVAAALSVSIEDTAAAIGLLANQGIKGEQAGTSLRGILASLASPSEAAAGALKTLGVEAFNTEGKFIGLRAFTDQLAKAKGRLTDAEFAAAASTAFGNEGFTAANALAAEGAVSFDEMAVSVARAGGAADVAAAQTKGLGGAWEGFKSQLETAGIEVYEVIAPGLERATRSAADFVARFTPTIVTGLERAIAAGELFGPGLADAIAARGDAAIDAVREIVEPLADGIVDTLNSAVNIGTTLFTGFAKVVRSTADAVKPLTEGVGNLLESLDQAGGPVSVLVGGLELVYNVTSGIIDVISPLVGFVGGLASAFGDLPGPIQSAAIALLALRVGPSILGGLKSAFSGAKTEAGEAANQAGFFSRSVGLMTAPVRLAASGIGSAASAVRQFGDEARVQRAIADQAGESVGRLGSYAAAFNVSAIPAVASARSFAEQTSAIRDGAAAAGQPISAMGAAIGTLVERSSTLSAMRSAFDNASLGAERFGRTAGIAAAAGTGLRSAAGGLLSALGGPWGLAIGAGVTLLGLFSSASADAQAEQDALAESGRTVARAIQEQNGAINGAVRSAAAKEAADRNLLSTARTLGIDLGKVTDAILGEGNAYEQLKAQIESAIAAREAQIRTSQDRSGKTQAALQGEIDQYRFLLDGINAVSSEKNNELQQTRDIAAATGQSAEAMVAATDRGRSLGEAMSVLANNTSSADDKARALKTALDALSGGTLTLEQSQSRVNEILAQMSDAFGENVDKAKGWGQALLNADGSVNTTTENGRNLLDMLDELATATADVATQTYETAIAQGDTAPEAMKKAEAAANGVRNSLIAQADQLGLTTDQVQALADRYGIVPEDIITLIQTPGMSQSQTEMIILQQLISRVPDNKPIRVQSLSDEAKAKLIDLGFIVNTLPDGQFEVIARDGQARGALDSLVASYANRTFYWNVRIQSTEVGRQGAGGRFTAAQGAIVTAAYARGGIHPKLTPMRSGIAAVVPPNTWRIVGDRLRDDEFYIPDDDSPRSISIGLEWARRRGFVLARTFATGGVATSTTQDRPVGTIAGPPIIQNNHFPPNLDEERVADLVMDKLSWRR